MIPGGCISERKRKTIPCRGAEDGPTVETLV